MSLKQLLESERKELSVNTMMVLFQILKDNKFPPSSEEQPNKIASDCNPNYKINIQEPKML